MKVYLASSFSRQKELLKYAKLLKKKGHKITSSWLTEEADALLVGDHTRTLYAVRDKAEVELSDTFIQFTNKPSDGYLTSGKQVELGFAIAFRKKIICIGEPENIFHHYPGILFFKTWKDFIKTS